MLALSQPALTDVDGYLAAYDAMVANAPADLAEPVRTLGPLTHQLAELSRNGTITTPEALRDWLTHTVPPAQLAEFLNAEQAIVPAIQKLCTAA